MGTTFEIIEEWHKKNQKCCLSNHQNDSIWVKVIMMDTPKILNQFVFSMAKVWFLQHLGESHSARKNGFVIGI
jgi:hypothetical protein